PSFRSSPGDQPSREATTGQSPLGPDRSWRRSFVRGSIAVTGLAITYAAFLWSHPPTAFQFSMALAVFVPALAIARKKWGGIFLAGVGVAGCLAPSRAFLYPAHSGED